MKYKLFVYGSLKKHQWNHYFIEGAKFLGEACIEEGVGLVVENLPYLIKDPKGPGVFGELYDVSAGQLGDCDILESHPRFYKRELIDVVNLDTGHKDKAYVYIFQKEVKDKNYVRRF